MKKLQSLIILLFLSSAVLAQPFGNEWIDYSQTYLKCKVAEDGVYRITGSSLVSQGLSASGTNVQVWRDGKQVPVYVSTSGNLTGATYIEFYGRHADGEVDEPLFKNVNEQMNPYQHLTSDTAVYFITRANSGPHLRFTQEPNNVVGAATPEPYCWELKEVFYRNTLSQGPSYFGSSSNPVLYLRSSQYEGNEGFVKSFSYNQQNINTTLSRAYKAAGAPAAELETTLAGFSYLSQHQVRIESNGSLLGISTFPRFTFKKEVLNFPMSAVPSNNVYKLSFIPQNSIPTSNLYDRIGVSYLRFRYPRTWNFSNGTGEYFELNPKATDYNIEITNFNNGGIAPRLYDLNSNKYIVGNIANASNIRFNLQASTSRKELYLVSQNGAKSVAALKKVNFVNYSQAANQGEYAILTHPFYYDDGNGNNYVQKYANYRASAAGGNHDVMIVETEAINDEFGYGYDFNIQAIRNFVSYGLNSSSWNNKLENLFIIGKGIKYSDYLDYSANASIYDYIPIPTFGVPASDQMLVDVDNDNSPDLPIGRLSVMDRKEIDDYLDKVKEHESDLNNPSNQNAQSILWRKNVLHIAGTSNANEQAPIVFYLSRQENSISDSCYGGNVTTLKKSSSAPVQSAASEEVDKLLNNGVGLIQFFGHGSSSTMDFNLDFPENYSNKGKYPLFIANGCGVGNMFINTSIRTLGERYVIAPEAGSIAFLANSSTGLTTSLALYTDSIYGQFSRSNYGKSIGEQAYGNLDVLNSIPAYANDNLLRIHREQISLQGDPAIMMFGSPQEDYAVENNGVQIQQLNVTTNMDSFDVKIIAYNLGKYSRDSIDLKITRTFPDNSSEVVLVKKYAGLKYSDTLDVRVAVGGTMALGSNAINVSIDDEELIVEMTESNNKVTKTFQIYTDDLVPVYPYDFSIVSQQGVTLKASTLDPFVGPRQYVLQIDTTEKFNSSFLKTKRIISGGGVIKWTPTISLQDSVVYYWRTAMDTLYGNPQQRWTNSSFVYLNGNPHGWSQSHYYQYAKDAYSNMRIDSNARLFRFDNTIKSLQVQNVCLNGPDPYKYVFADYLVKINGVTQYTFGCVSSQNFESLQFMVIDSLTGLPWRNAQITPSLGTIPNENGRFGSHKPCRTSDGDPFFSFRMDNLPRRQNIINFLNGIPNGHFVMMQPFISTRSNNQRNNEFISNWMSDTTSLGSGNSLYHSLKGLGFTMIDSFYKNRPMIFFTQKGIGNTEQYIGADSTVKLFADFDFSSYETTGDMTSTKIGRASKWNHFYRGDYSLDGSLGDSAAVEIYGISPSGTSNYLATVFGDTSLSFINAQAYPCLRLQLSNTDDAFATPEQMKYWRVHYDPLPEIALNPSMHFEYLDTMYQGQVKNVEIAIENLTDIDTDSLLVDYNILDANGISTSVGSVRFKEVTASDTIIASFPFNTQSYSGPYTFQIEANPNDDQPEQYHPNNLGYRPLYIFGDDKNPVIDVTFDGVHILNEDIVSAQPNILISLTDENKFLALDDTSGMQVYLRYPDNPNLDVYIPYDNSILTFIPASGNISSDNRAMIEFNPTFLDDGLYELILNGKDKSNNKSGVVSHKVSFNVINKTSISSVINYPNPFSTQTQFIFTLTGSEVPDNLKIQILNMTGRVVREITKAELGQLHIGRNITEFRWQGDDQFGKKLGNGVYLYRVVSSLNGQKMDAYTNQLADQWIDKGFGKLYIMR